MSAFSFKSSLFRRCTLLAAVTTSALLACTNSEDSESAGLRSTRGRPGVGALQETVGLLPAGVGPGRLRDPRAAGRAALGPVLLSQERDAAVAAVARNDFDAGLV